MLIKIYGWEDEELEVEDVYEGGYLPAVTLEDGTEWYIARDREHAGFTAAERWRDMARHDPEEFRTLVGDEALIAWALGQPGGPGSVKVNSLEEWFSLVADHPEEEWAGYDGEEHEGRLSKELAKRLGWRGWGGKDVLLYRHN
jgi:hypothetical protein